MPFIAMRFSPADGAENDGDFEPVDFGGWSAPCWACGRMVHQTNDDAYNDVDQGARSNTWFVANSAEHAEKMRELIRYLETLEPDTSPDVIAAELEARGPLLQPVADWLRTNKSELGIAAASTAISLLMWLFPSSLASHDDDPPPPSNITKHDLDRLVDEIARLRAQETNRDAQSEQGKQDKRHQEPPGPKDQGRDVQPDPEPR